MRWRARRESVYIRCSPPTLLQQCGRGIFDVRMVAPLPGLEEGSYCACAGVRDLLTSSVYVRRGTACAP